MNDDRLEKVTRALWGMIAPTYYAANVALLIVLVPLVIFVAVGLLAVVFIGVPALAWEALQSFATR